MVSLEGNGDNPGPKKNKLPPYFGQKCYFAKEKEKEIKLKK
jgi:hypothetical protein